MSPRSRGPAHRGGCWGELQGARGAARHVGTARAGPEHRVPAADGANLTVVSLQVVDGRLRARVLAAGQAGPRSATFKHGAREPGGDLVRVTPSTRSTAPGGDVETYGLTFVTTASTGAPAVRGPLVPRCRSRVNYKSALQGETCTACGRATPDWRRGRGHGHLRAAPAT
ncbi:SufD family Fe-S cluster assembly protein [Kocuria rhizophila]|nr:SufD family Fe-S cluster assembly protein [Kocuria rhizophila]